MNFRQWIFDKLTTDPDLVAIHEGRVVSTRGLRERPELPFLAIDFSTSTDLLSNVAERQLFRVWVHDEAGSYDVIDEALELLRNLLVTGESDADVLACSFSENSPDFFDSGLNTAVRFGRYYVTRIREGV